MPAWDFVTFEDPTVLCFLFSAAALLTEIPTVTTIIVSAVRIGLRRR
jgi:hypothetical protein